MQALLAERGLDAGGFRARQLEARQVREADLVLTMTARQRGAAVALVPAAVRRTFTLRELARLLDGVDPERVAQAGADGTGERLGAALPLAAARRGFRPDPREDDVADPYGRDDQAFRRAFDAVTDAVDRVARVVVGGPSRPA